MDRRAARQSWNCLLAVGIVLAGAGMYVHNMPLAIAGIAGVIAARVFGFPRRGDSDGQ